MSELYHHGILGQKWGVRRYQNADGTLTDAGKKHYAKQERKEAAGEIKKLHNDYRYAKAASVYYHEDWKTSRKKREKAAEKGKSSAEKYSERASKSSDLSLASGDRRDKLERQLDKAVGSYLKKYGDKGIKDVVRASNKDVYSMGKTQAHKILFSDAYRSTQMGTFVAGPIGGVAAGLAGYQSDKRRLQAYENSLGNELKKVRKEYGY